VNFAQRYLGCLSHASRLIGDKQSGRAWSSITGARSPCTWQKQIDGGLTIVGEISTHFRADFVSGRLGIARATGAWACQPRGVGSP